MYRVHRTANKHIRCSHLTSENFLEKRIHERLVRTGEHSELCEHLFGGPWICDKIISKILQSPRQLSLFVFRNSSANSSKHQDSFISKPIIQSFISPSSLKNLRSRTSGVNLSLNLYRLFFTVDTIKRYYSQSVNEKFSVLFKMPHYIRCC